MRVLDNNPSCWLVMTDDGTTTTKSKSSDLNQLLFGAGLHGLLEEGSEIWVKNPEGEEKVTVIPDDDAECYTVRIEGYPDDLYLGSHQKTKLVAAMAEMYREYDGESVVPMLRMYEDIRGEMIRKGVLVGFEGLPRVEVRDDGWFINGHLLLSWEGDFFHPNTTSRKRSGQQVIGENTSRSAYSVSIDNPGEELNRDVEVGGKEYRLTDAELMFLAKALWAVENTPDRT